MTETDEKVYTLTALDRCDACSAQAYIHVKGVSGELFFCGHHYDKTNKVKLEEFAFEIIDERDQLFENNIGDED